MTRAGVLSILGLACVIGMAACGASGPDAPIPQAIADAAFVDATNDASADAGGLHDAMPDASDAGDANDAGDAGLPACKWKKFSAGASASLRNEGGSLVFASPVPAGLTYVGRLDLDQVVSGDFEASIELRTLAGGEGSHFMLELECAGTAARAAVTATAGGKRALRVIAEDGPKYAAETESGVFRLAIARKGMSVTSTIERNASPLLKSSGATTTATQTCAVYLYAVTGGPPAPYRAELDTFRGSGAAACADDFATPHTY